MADWLAVAWIRQGQAVKARDILRKQRVAGGLDSQGIGILAALEALADQYQAAEELYLEAARKNCLTTELNLRYAVLLFAAGKREAAVAEFAKLKNLGSSADDSREASQGELALPTDAANEVQRIRGRVVSSVARIYLAHLLWLGQNGDVTADSGLAESLAELETLAKGGEDLLQGERMFYQILGSATLTDRTRLRQLRQALKLTSGHPIVSLHLAQALLQNGKAREAIRVYESLEETESLLARSAQVEVAKALAQVDAGPKREALQALRICMAPGIP